MTAPTHWVFVSIVCGWLKYNTKCSFNFNHFPLSRCFLKNKYCIYFWLDKKGKMMQAPADRAKSDIEKHKNQLLALQGPTDTVHFEDPSKKRKLEALKMAREAAAKKPKPVMRALTFAPA